jgi:cytochrome c-type biogenesis protein CcmF
MYEYSYAIQHVSDDLSMKYILSAFWEGQEGSFLLWMFWNVILGLVILRFQKNWSAPILAVLSLLQAFLLTMILGIYVGWGDELIKIGSNPILLFRETTDLPLFRNAEYLSLITGNGLNPLLQNYWMTIHPPVLFLGFSSTLIPFCFAIAGLWTNDHKSWLKPALPWALFSGAFLGIGILMGGAWAYEALSFGGYWAWDPVENMSLVPWLILIAGIHTHLIAKNTHRSIRSTYLFYLLSFVLVLYSTFLTRSGILGDTSVHSFTEMGLEWQLIGLMACFGLIGLINLFRKWKSITEPEGEEKIESREFWMFIGTLVLLFSGMLITIATSLPVINKIVQVFNEDFTALVIEDPIDHYNKYQLWIAVFIGILSSVAQYLRFQERNWKLFKKAFFKHLLIAVGITIILFIPLQIWLNLLTWQYVLLLVISTFTVASNLEYLWKVTTSGAKFPSSVISHLGFALMIIGILASGVNKSFITSNSFAFDGLVQNKQLAKNIQLIKGKPMFSQGYWINYVSDTLVDNQKIYTINYKKENEQGDIVETFNLYPNALYANDFSKIASFNPSTKHYIHKDIFTHIPALPKPQMDIKFAREMEDSLRYENFRLLTDSVTTVNDRFEVRLKEVLFNPSHSDYVREDADFALGLSIEVNDLEKEVSYTLEPVTVIRGGIIYKFHDQLNEIPARFRLNESIFDNYFSPESDLEYQEYKIKRGENFDLKNFHFDQIGFNQKPNNAMYQPEEGDISISSVLLVSDGTLQDTLEPVYVLRENQAFYIMDFSPVLGIYVKFKHIDPVEETIHLEIASEDRGNVPIDIEIAQNVVRDDLIVLESIVFPGINLFWLGSIMMMAGMFLAMFTRIKQNKKHEA